MSYLFPEVGTYPVAFVVKNNSGCSDTVVKAIQVAEDFLIYVPDTFTPNEDARNDLFKPVIRGVSSLSFFVYDRWGHLLFSTADPATGWDGTVNGIACRQGVYSWSISLLTLRGENKACQGKVTLLRQ